MDSYDKCCWALIALVACVVGFCAGFCAGILTERTDNSPSSHGYRACMNDIQFFGIDAVKTRYHSEGFGNRR